MINIRELRIGNWVKVMEPDKYVGAIGKIQTLSSLEGSYFTINIDDPNFGYLHIDVFCEDLEPIPLTEEILIQNGFPEDEWHGSFPEDKNGLFYIVLSFNKIFWEFNDCRIEIKYVHQLQNLLRDMGIEKEIIL